MPSILLATVATIIASQALISGAFTLVEQAIALGLAPRMRVLHTSAEQRGQVYIPLVNALLGTGCIILVAAFQASSRLASAFGLAVSCTMLATSIAWYAVIVRRKMLPPYVGIPMLIGFVMVDGSFVVAGLPKFADGGWVPFSVSTILTVLTLIWVWGRRRMIDALRDGDIQIAELLAKTANLSAVTTPPVVLLTADPTRVPTFLIHPWAAERIKTTTLVLMHIDAVTVPRVAHDQRVRVQRMSPRVYVVEARIGYMEPPRIRPIIAACGALGLDLSQEGIMFGYTLPVLESVGYRNVFRRILTAIFASMLRNARRLSDDLEIPAAQRVGLGMEVKL